MSSVDIAFGLEEALALAEEVVEEHLLRLPLPGFLPVGLSTLILDKLESFPFDGIVRSEKLDRKESAGFCALGGLKEELLWGWGLASKPFLLGRLLWGALAVTAAGALATLVASVDELKVGLR